MLRASNLKISSFKESFIKAFSKLSNVKKLSAQKFERLELFFNLKFATWAKGNSSNITVDKSEILSTKPTSAA